MRSRARAVGICLRNERLWPDFVLLETEADFALPPVLQNVRHRFADPDHPALDVEDGVPPPRAAPPLLRRVVLSIGLI